jgi:hypothetical protein
MALLLFYIYKNHFAINIIGYNKNLFHTHLLSHLEVESPYAIGKHENKQLLSHPKVEFLCNRQT